ncbi:L-lactate permease [Desulfallas thermosapovorans]|uniref:L-lactate permease n=1 Tax=Desulfallas thermosapovorans DSM 6562 TaxID=1121431 RepID=A0A5S4ZV86_9FIRM|nr:lactate permease LctP family transporter [Desulfallas thermosapovorans]TYO96901.1 lactate permease [Desulfallas thermosapovorans DSM 6562]
METWTQVINPFNNLGISALVSSIPILFLFFALAIVKMKGHVAGLATLVIANLVAIIAFQMPSGLAVYSSIYGAMTGLFPIGWIVITAVFLYQLTVKTGQFEIIKDSIASVTEDRRLQALLIAFSFGAFIEGAAGFGTPVAITAAMLVGLGFNPLYAAGICLIANTAPVAFGGIGIPIVTAGAVSGIDAHVIGQMVGRQLPFLSFFVPFWLVFIMSGWKGVKEVMPAILVSGGSFAIAQWFSASYMGPLLPDIISALVSIICLVLFLRVWKPKNIWRFPEEPPRTMQIKKHTAGEVLKAWSPFIILTIMIADWGVNSVKAILDKVTILIPMTGLDQAIIVGGEPMAVIYKFNWLSAAGTAILLSAIITAFILKIKPAQFLAIFFENLKNLRYALLTIASVLGFAFIANYSGMTPTLGKAFTVTGILFPFMSAFLGWVGVFITGSDTSSNALFGKMQLITAESMDINPVLTVATNSSGGVAAKMISPQSIAVATASCGLVGREAELFRFTFKHSIFFTVIIGIIAFLQAYVLEWMVPAVKMITQEGGQAAANAAGGGVTILALTLLFILLLGLYANKQGRSLDKFNVSRG